MAKLYVVATPIGNLKDITQRAIETLKEVDLILCENPKITQKLLIHYQIKKPLFRYHQHSKLKSIDQIIKLLKEGKNLALVSDAGTPGISDPGGKLIQKIIENLNEKIEIIPIPGPSAITCAVSICDFPMDRFLFLGFPPKKKKRKRFFEEIINSNYPVIFFESPYRILKTLNELKSVFNECNKNKKFLRLKLIICKELTKKFEKIYRGEIEKVIKEIERDKIKGEFVIIVEKMKKF